MPRKTTKKSGSIGRRKGDPCGELLALLNEYVDGDVTPGVCRKLESHLAKCDPCRVVVDNVRKTITLYRNDKPCDLPVKFRKSLRAMLCDCWKTASRPKAKRKCCS